MSYDPHITAARREAKLRARNTGASYQSMLEEVARQTGAASWSSFIAHPAPLGPPTPGAEVAAPAHPPIRPRRGIWYRWGWAAAALMASILVVAGNHLIGVNASYGFRSQQERNAAPKMVFTGMPGFLGDRSYPYYVQRGDDGALETVAMFLDVRTTPFDPARLHAHMMAMLTTGQTHQEWTYLGHGLSRFVFATNCDAGTITMRRRENTDWYTGHADHVYATPGSKPIRLSTDAMHELCAPSAMKAMDRIEKAVAA
jgi:hypothetical protein